MMLTSVLTATLALVLATNAWASGKTVNVGSPLSSGPPSVTVDNAGNAFIAWADTRDVAGADNFVQYCVLPVAATGCAHSGNLIPADSAKFIDGVHVLSDGATLVVLADVFGAAGSSAGDYEPVQEWQSTDGGATFTIVNGGLSVTSGVLNADTGPLSAVIVPGTGVLGFGWDTVAGSPTFNAFSLSAPAECSTVSCPAGFASLEPPTNPDQISNPFGAFAAQSVPAPGVLGIFDTIYTNGPLGCAKTFGTAYAYGSGSQAATNNYNISPGSPNSAWKVAISKADCNVEHPAVGGGPSGFGVLETDDGTATTVYHRFDQATMKFDTPTVTVAKMSESSSAVTQDGAGGVYGTYLLDGPGGPIALSYSADGGKTWSGATLNANKSGGADEVTSWVNGAGQGWAAWIDNGSVFAQPFQASDAISPASVGGGASSTGKTVTVTVSCPSVPCTITITITATTTSASAAAKKHKSRTITLVKSTFTLRKAGRRTVTLHLTNAGKKFLRSRHGHIKVGLRFSDRVQHHTVSGKRTLTLTIKHPKK
jgi:hypothetical protein